MGNQTYPEAKQLLIMADAGGSNASRSRLWKVGLQRLANVTGLHIHVSHFPPGTPRTQSLKPRVDSPGSVESGG